MGLADLPTLADMEALRRGKPIPKGPSRLTDRVAQTKADQKKDETFRRDVFRLDKGRCRCCGRRVVRKLDRVVDRAEVHHVHGRTGELRWLVKAALLLCAEDHERVTGKVNERLAIVGTRWFTVDGQRYINARARVRFEKERSRDGDEISGDSRPRHLHRRAGDPTLFGGQS